MSDPYAPPTVFSEAVSPDVPRSLGWAIENGRLWVESTAILPMVDPYSGASPDRMHMNLVKVRYRPPWLWMFPLILALAGAWLGAYRDSVMNAIGAGLIGLILRMLVGLAFPKASLQVFFSSRTLRWRRGLSAALTVLFLLNLMTGPVIEMTKASGAQVPGWILESLGWAWLSLLGYALVLQRRLLCTRMRNGRFEIRRVHPRMLAQLERIPW